MKWLPPLTLAGRYEWMKARPWVAGSYFGALLAVLAVIIGTIGSNIWVGLGLGVPIGVLCMLLVTLSIKRRWGERVDAEDHPLPTMRRPLSRASDRILIWASFFAGASALLELAQLILRVGDDLVHVVGLAVSGAWILAAGAERRRRRLDR
jgi:hypothetical protein